MTRRLLGLRDARLYLAGQSCSLLGDTALWLALALWARELSGSASAGGMVIFCIAAPQLASPLSGLLADRVRRRSLLLAVNPLTALAVLPLLAVHSASDLWIIYAVSVAYGVSYTLLGAGQSALLATMLPDELLPAANAVLQTVREALRLVAPVLGVGLFTLAGGRTVALLDAATFLVATATLLALRFREPPPERHTEHWRAAVAAGGRHVWRTVPLRQLALGGAASVLVIGFSETMLFAIPAGLHRPSSFAGVLMFAGGLGAIIGAATTPRALARHGEGRAAGLGLAVLAIGTLATADASVALVLAGQALFGFGLPWLIVGVTTLVQRASPPRLQGRVYSAMEIALGLPQTLSIALGAVLATAVDYRLLLVTEAVVAAAAGLYLLTRRELVH
jgi:MFS family permease